jgi:hypothetical protein
VALGAVAAASSATTAAAGSDALFQLLQLETDMPHGFSPPFCMGLARLQIFILEKDFLRSASRKSIEELKSACLQNVRFNGQIC